MSKRKDSGIFWLGDIPTHWEVYKIGHVFVSGSGTTPQSDAARYYDGEIPWLTTSELREDIITSTAKHVTKLALQEYSSLKLYPAGSLVIAMYGATIGRVGILGIDSTVNQACCVLLPSSLCTVEYAFYWFQVARESLLAAALGGGQPNLSQEMVVSQRMPLPPFEEQLRIVARLKLEIGALDQLAAARQQQLALLEEKRRAIITQAVTQGLDASAPHRDSGFEWLGRIPAHWANVKFKFLTDSLQTGPFGSQLHAEEYIDNGVPVINPAHLRNGKITADERITVSEGTAHKLAIHKLQVGDIIFARRGELGRCAVVTAEQEGWICGTGSLRARLRLDVVEPDYLQKLIEFAPAHEWLSLQSVGSTMDNLNTEILGELPLPVPPITEQCKILIHIEDELRELSKLHYFIQKSLSFLQQKRASLITAAVKGQLFLPTTAHVSAQA